MPYRTYYTILVSICGLLDDRSCQDFDSIITIRNHNEDARNDNRSNRPIESHLCYKNFEKLESIANDRNIIRF